MERSDDGLLEWLQRWYESHCNGDWEHDQRIELHTLDNPGWWLSINVEGTALEGRSLDRVEIENSEADWLHYWAENDQFRAVGGARNLATMLRVFRDWVEPPTG